VVKRERVQALKNKIEAYEEMIIGAKNNIELYQTEIRKLRKVKTQLEKRYHDEL